MNTRTCCAMTVALVLYASVSVAEEPASGEVAIPYTAYTNDRSRVMFMPETRKLLQEAQALEKEGHTQEAIDKYQDAYDLQPLSDVETEIAFAQARAGLWLPAARHLHEVLSMRYVRER